MSRGADRASSDRAADAFHSVHGRGPTGVWSAPGRVNLIGEHTDYNDGYVLPFALTDRVAVAASPRDDGILTVASLGSDGTVRRGDPVAVADLRPGYPHGWPAYPAGVAWVLSATDIAEAHGVTGGADLVLASSVPTGAGLSSSAAVECAVAMALLGLGGQREPDADRRTRIAGLAHRAENEFVGVPTGMLDQMASMCCAAGHVLFLDVRSGLSEAVPFDVAGTGLRVLVIDTRTKHSLGESGYGDRRRGTERVADLLGVSALRDVTDEALPVLLPRLPEELRGLLRHVVTENQRVLDVVELLRAGEVAEIGRLLDASHESLRRDYQVSSPELDLAVDAARQAGALGARMTGAGFGGSAIALVRVSEQGAVRDSVRTSFRRAGLTEPRMFTALPSAGARQEE